jgi:redox-sensitive bicupin YhaK (pirin superfamily)
MGRENHGWLDSRFHFSFADYYNPESMQFGVLRVVNDDLVQPDAGFPTHPHADMEILSYVVDGELTHGDSMGNQETLRRGQVQYKSAGTGVTHSELNLGDSVLRFLQIWIFPDEKGYEPNYGDYRFAFADREDKWLPIATWTENRESTAPIKIHQDANVYATAIKAGETVDFEVREGRQAYMVLIEGEAQVNEVVDMVARDALGCTEDLKIEVKQDAHILIIEMNRTENAY